MLDKWWRKEPWMNEWVYDITYCFAFIQIYQACSFWVHLQQHVAGWWEQMRHIFYRFLNSIALSVRNPRHIVSFWCLWWKTYSSSRLICVCFSTKEQTTVKTIRLLKHWLIVQFVSYLLNVCIHLQGALQAILLMLTGSA